MPFLRNAWYAAGWSHEISRVPLARTILARPVLLYRQEDGSPVALSDRCPHRSAPLHKGTLVGNNIQCPYHGLQFDPTGACAFNPGGRGVLPGAARVHQYPIAERHKAIWIWTGDPARADATQIVDLEYIDDTARWRTVTDVLHAKANYQLIADNLLDLSHVEFRHPQMARPGSNQRMKRSTRQDGRVVTAFNESAEEPMTDLFLKHWPPGRESGKGKLWADMRWHAPSVLLLDTGTTGVGRPREEGVRVPSAHLLTPETESTSHYFWASSRNWGLEDPELDDEIRTNTQRLFRTEDLDIIEEQQRYLELEGYPSPVLLPPDEAAVRARRVLERLIAEEDISAGTSAHTRWGTSATP
jgi:vanillate O-demethylase monooxygenase subunit